MEGSRKVVVSNLPKQFTWLQLIVLLAVKKIEGVLNCKLNDENNESDGTAEIEFISHQLALIGVVKLIGLINSTFSGTNINFKLETVTDTNSDGNVDSEAPKTTTGDEYTTTTRLISEISDRVEAAIIMTLESSSVEEKVNNLSENCEKKINTLKQSIAEKRSKLETVSTENETIRSLIEDFNKYCDMILQALPLNLSIIPQDEEREAYISSLENKVEQMEENIYMMILLNDLSSDSSVLSDADEDSSDSSVLSDADEDSSDSSVLSDADEDSSDSSVLSDADEDET